MSAPCARSSSTCSAFPVETRASDERRTTLRMASSSSSICWVRSARKRSKYADATCVSTSRCFWSRSARAIAASARAASARAPRFPPNGRLWLSWTITGTVEKSDGAFQSWTISIGSSSAPAGSTALCVARARAVAAFNSGFFSRASRKRSARRRGSGAASATDSSTAIIASLPLERSGLGGRMRTTRHGRARCDGFTRGSDQQGSMTEVCRWSGRWCDGTMLLGCSGREYVREQHRGGVDGDNGWRLLPLLLHQPDPIERVESPLLAARAFANLRVLRRGRLRTADDLLARVPTEQPGAGHRRRDDDRQKGKNGGATPQHCETITHRPRHRHDPGRDRRSCTGRRT